jgi:hypothetical protein
MWNADRAAAFAATRKPAASTVICGTGEASDAD